MGSVFVQIRLCESSMKLVSAHTPAPKSSIDTVLVFVHLPESSMDAVLVQKRWPCVQIVGPWTIIPPLLPQIPSMDSILMHAIVQEPHIGAKRPRICADIGSMDEFGLSLAVAPRSAVAMNSISSSHPCARGGSSCLYPLQRIRRLFTNFTWHRLWKRSRKNESSVRAKSRKDRLLNMGKGVGLYQHPFIGYIVVL